MKSCSRCKLSKPETSFWKHGGTKDGLRSDCIECVNASRKVTRRGMAAHVFKMYGLTLEEYDARLEASTGCAICKQDLKLNQDHNAKTGQLRDFLCGPCNRGLGMFGESVERLQAAITYLIRHGAAQ